MLREALPEIVTGSVPGAKAKAILDRRNELKSVYLIATRDLSNLWLQFFYLKIKGLCDFLRKRF